MRERTSASQACGSMSFILQVYAARGTMATSVGAGERQFFTEFAESALRDLAERDVDLAIVQGFKANIQPRAMTTYCCSGCNCVGSCVCTLTRGDGRVGTSLRVELAVGEDANVLGRWFCPEATRRAICSWICLSCSAMVAICSWLALSCSARSALLRTISCVALRCSASSALSRTICACPVLS